MDCRGLAFAVTVALLLPSLSRAQSSDESRNEAREAFVRATQAAEEERWADALQGFEQAYVLSGVPVALYNAAMVLRAIGRHKDARDAFDRLLTDHPDYEGREEAENLRREEAARVAILELANLDPQVDYTIRLDGRQVEIERGRTADVETDAGTHNIEADREGYQTFSWDGSIRDGERRRIEVVMEEIVVERRPLRKSAAFWIITGVVIIGAAVLTGILLQRGAQLEPDTNNVVDLD